MIKILFVCHGNICRSTMAESVFTYLAQKAGVAENFLIDSAATSTEEIGNPVHFGTRDMLKREGIPCIPHRAVQMRKSDYGKYDYIIGMDNWNVKNILRITGGDPESKVYRLLDFTERRGQDIADPWYTGEFDVTFRDVLEGCEGLLRTLSRDL